MNEAFFEALQAHSDCGEAFIDALVGLGDYELRGDLRAFGAPYAVTNGTVFAGASDMRLVYFRLNPADRAIALASGGEPAPAALGDAWVRFVLFRADWPRIDLKHFARRAYDFARVT